MKKFLLFALITGLALTTYSCKDESDDDRAEEDREMLLNLSDEMIGDLDQMTESSGMQALKALMELMEIQDPMFGPDLKSTADDRYKSLLFPSFGKKPATKSGSVEGFGFDEKTGTYTWSAEHQGWTIEQNDPTDKIIIIFPTGGPESHDNNATLTLHELTSETFEDYWDSWEQPTRLKADLFVDDTRVIEVDLSVRYDSEGEPMEIDIYLLVSPFELSLAFEDTGSMFKVAALVRVDNLDLMSADLKLSYIIEKDDWDYDETVITSVEGYVHYGSMKISGNINIAALDEIDDVTVDDLNAYVNLRLERYPGGRKIADIDFIEEVPGDPDTIEPRLTFVNGTTALAKDFFQPVADALEARLQEFLEEWTGESDM